MLDYSALALPLFLFGWVGDDMELPNLKSLHGTPMLFVMALGYVTLLASIVYLTQKRTDSMDKAQADLNRLLQNCMNAKDSK